MLFQAEPIDISIINPQFKVPLPEWAEPILNFLSERILMGADQLIRCFWPTGYRKGRKILFNLSNAGYLQRYEISTSEKHLVAYTLGAEGVKYTRLMVPAIDIIKAQELIIANEFCFKNGIADLHFWVNHELTIGEVKFENDKYTLWCPRQEEHRISSLVMQVPGTHRGLIAIAPTLKHIYKIAEQTKDFTFQVFFTTDAFLDQFMVFENGILKPM